MSRTTLRQKIKAQTPTFTFLTGVLLCFGLLDELGSGFPFIGLPLIRDQLHLSYEQIGFIFTVGEITALFFEPVMNLYSDRGSKRLWVVGGMLGISASFLLAGLANGYLLLLLAFAGFYVSTTVAMDMAQATLIDRNPSEGTRTMTRWTLLAGIGDLLAPLTVSLVVSLQLGWSALCWIGSAMWLGMTLLVAPLRFPHPHATQANDEQATEADEEEERAQATELDEEGERENVWVSLKEAVRDPVLLRWVLLASLIPTMVDEIFLGFSTLYLHDVIRANDATIGIVITIDMIGGLLGLFVLDRLEIYRRMSPAHLMALLAVIALVGMVLFLSANQLWLVSVGLFIVSASVSGWYPIAKAQAYAQRPGRSGLIRTVIALTAPLEIGLPTLVGFIAGRAGLLAGLGILALAPLLVLLLLIGAYNQKTPIQAK